MTYPPTISNQDINELELSQYDGKVEIITTAAKLDKAIGSLSRHKVVGFDTETKPSFRRGVKNDVALIQLAIEKKVWLIRVQDTGMTDALVGFLSDPAKKKIGVALRDDIKDLQLLRKFTPGGFVELNQLVKKIGIESNGLRKLTAIILGFRISKSAQTSNWENDILTDKQISYAATDAWVCIRMYNELNKKGYIY